MADGFSHRIPTGSGDLVPAWLMASLTEFPQTLVTSDFKAEMAHYLGLMASLNFNEDRVQIWRV